jgi:tRNA(Ser,Leu) C12 N-acetylase TAN1
VKDWNVVVSIYQDGYRRALRSLRGLGSVERSPYHNVLVMRADDPAALLEAIERRTEESPALYDAISRVAPAQRGFNFHSAQDLDQQATSTFIEWLPRLAGRSFHVRFHRRGPHPDLKTPDVERRLDDAVLAASSGSGTPASVSFTDPDVVIAVDTVDDRAGIALWTREDLARHRLLRPD